MHPEFLQQAISDNERSLEQTTRRAHLHRPWTDLPAATIEPVILRLCTVRDDCTLDRLAELEGKAAPRGRYVVAEIDGTVVAALPLGSGALLADPFRPTAHLVPLLELRAKELIPAPRRGPAVWGAVRSWSRAW